MTPTSAQLVVLKADIVADLVLNAEPQNSDGAFAIAAAYNLIAVPQFTVWKSLVTAKEAITAMVWTEFIPRSVGERDAWKFMLQDGGFDAGDANVQQGIQDIFSGPGGAASRVSLIAIAKRDATRIEALLATGTGSIGSPATLAFKGGLSYQDVLRARNLP